MGSMTDSIQIVVNGEARMVAAGVTVADLIRELGLSKAACAAEVNKKLVPRREQGTRRLEEKDAVELVTLVGGG
jgi:thiamine biosynthesis protein ThiS